MYTDADSLGNKISDLKTLNKNKQYDIIEITKNFRSKTMK